MKWAKLFPDECQGYGTGPMDDYSWEYLLGWEENKSSITTVVVEDGVTSIGDSAFFECTSLTSVTIPNNVSKISVGAFRGCESLTSVLIPDSVTEIKMCAFVDCKRLMDITLPASLTSIGASAFNACHKLKNIMIPDKVSKIGNGAFMFCFDLETVTIPASVTEIEEDAFVCCGSLKSISVSPDNSAYSSEDGVLFNKDKTRLIRYPVGKEGDIYSIPTSVTEICKEAFAKCCSLKNITIPNSVSKIGDRAFELCDGLTSITLPDGITEIGDCTFRCRRLMSIAIPAGVTKIEERAFSECVSLKCIAVSPDNPAFISVDGILFNKDKTRLIMYPADKEGDAYSIPTSVTEIGRGAFARCRNLKVITIPDSVTEIGDWAFAKCKGLRTITIPDGVMIGIDVFLFCFGLERVYYKGRVLEPVDGESIYTGTPETLISYYPKGDSSWEKAIKDGRWQGRRAEPWEPDLEG